MTLVMVYRFKIWNNDIGGFVVSQRLGTRGAIEMARGEIIEGTETEVPLAEIDTEGFTRRFED